MAPLLAGTIPRSTIFHPSIASVEFRAQWTNPGDVFSVLLIVGADVVGRALAQLAGGWLTPVTFSFGWVAYAVSALVSTVGENKLMPPTPDCASKVINGKNGYVRDNASWIVGRMVRDFDMWISPATKAQLAKILADKWAREKADVKEKGGDESKVPRPTQAGLCVSIYEPSSIAVAGEPTHDWIHYSGLVIAVFQLGIAAIPCGLFGDWGILLITSCGIVLAFASGSLPQWKKEKWACRKNSDKTVVLTRGNGAQHAIVILGNGKGLDLEDLAGGSINIDVAASVFTRVATAGLALLWILLLITAAGEKENTWFLLVVGGLGILHNTVVAGWPREPSAFGIHLVAHQPIGHYEVMDTLFEVEEKYPHVGASMLDTFFPGKLWPREKERWAAYELAAQKYDGKAKARRKELDRLGKEAKERMMANSDKESEEKEARDNREKVLEMAVTL